MRRREFTALLGSVAATWPVAARVQQSKSPVRIGMLPIGLPSNPYNMSLVEAFRQGLRDIGIVENRDVILDIVWIRGGDPEAAVSELIQRGARLLVPCGSSFSVAARRQTSTIPIVFLHVGDPIAMGLVDSLPRPGRNATGFSDILADLSGKLVGIAQRRSAHALSNSPQAGTTVTPLCAKNANLLNSITDKDVEKHPPHLTNAQACQFPVSSECR